MKRIKLSGKIGAGKYALVDNEDYSELAKNKWCLSTKGYVKRGTTVGGKHKTILMHTQIMGTPVGKVIDHKNHNPLDNRKENLRVCTHRQNCANMKLSKRNTSGYTRS